MLRRIPLLVDTPPKPWACVPEDFTAGRRKRVFHGGTMGFFRGAPYGSQSLREFFQVPMEKMMKNFKISRGYIKRRHIAHEIYQ